MKHTPIIAVAFILLFAGMAAAYPTVTISTPYSYSEPPKTTVLYNPYTGNTYVHGVGYTGNSNDIYAQGYYDGKYDRNPFYCQYDWFDRCKFDPDRAYSYYNSRCRNYDPGDHEWYDRGCDTLLGYGNSRYPNTHGYQYPYYNNYYYPRGEVYYVNDYKYNDNVYYGWY